MKTSYSKQKDILCRLCLQKNHDQKLTDFDRMDKFLTLLPILNKKSTFEKNCVEAKNKNYLVSV